MSAKTSLLQVEFSQPVFMKHKLSCVCIVEGMCPLLNFNENLIEILGINDHFAKIPLISTLSAPVLPTFFLQ